MVQVKLRTLLKMLREDRKVLQAIGFDHASAMVFIPGNGDFMGSCLYRRQGEVEWSKFEAYQRDLGEGYAVQWSYDIGGLGEASIVETNHDPRGAFDLFIRDIAKEYSATYLAGEIGEVSIEG